MRPGLYIWAAPSGSVVVLRIGWVRRISMEGAYMGDEMEALNQITPQRHGDFETMFADLAIDGPPKKWAFTRPIPGSCPLNRMHVFNPVPLQPAQWAKVCPRPEGWKEGYDH